MRKRMDSSDYLVLVTATLMVGFLFTMEAYLFVDDSVGQEKFMPPHIDQFIADEFDNSIWNETPSTSLFDYERSDVAPLTKQVLAMNQLFFNKMDENQKYMPPLNTYGEALRDLKQGWLILHKDWSKTLPKQRVNSNSWELFEKGLSAYKAAINYSSDLQTEGMHESNLQNAYFYFISYLKSGPTNERRSRALLLIGDIASRLWYKGKDFPAQVFLVEAIRTNPGSNIAQFAWNKLDETVKFGYAGSHGENTPNSWRSVLKDLKRLATEQTYTKIAGISYQ